MDYDDQDDYDGTSTGSQISKKTPSGNWALRTDCGESNSRRRLTKSRIIKTLVDTTAESEEEEGGGVISM